MLGDLHNCDMPDAAGSPSTHLSHACNSSRDVHRSNTGGCSKAHDNTAFFPTQATSRSPWTALKLVRVSSDLFPPPLAAVEQLENEIALAPCGATIPAMLHLAAHSFVLGNHARIRLQEAGPRKARRYLIRHRILAWGAMQTCQRAWDGHHRHRA